MDFLTWWFVNHYIWALFLTPGASFLYSLYGDYGFWWGAGCFVLHILKKVCDRHHDHK